MSTRHKGFVVLGALLLAEGFLKGAISKQARALGVNGAGLLAMGVVATAIVSALE